MLIFCATYIKQSASYVIKDLLKVVYIALNLKTEKSTDIKFVEKKIKQTSNHKEIC